MLKSYFIDTYYGRKLGVAPTTGGSSNGAWALGDKPQAALLADMKDGILITGFLGGNSNGTTGDFSFGVQGYRVRGGQIAEPVGEMNISGNQADLWKRLVAVGNDPYAVLGGPHADAGVRRRAVRGELTVLALVLAAALAGPAAAGTAALAEEVRQHGNGVREDDGGPRSRRFRVGSSRTTRSSSAAAPCAARRRWRRRGSASTRARRPRSRGEPEKVEVNDAGTMGMSIGPVFDETGKETGSFSSIWRREKDGRWRIIFDNGCNCVPPPPAPPTPPSPPAP